MRKTLLIGLDGGTFDVVDPLMRRGELPHLASLIERGVRGPLRSTVPPLTAPAWPSILSGLNPGRHGIYGFEALDHVTAATRESRPVSSHSFAGRTLFDHVGGHGGRVLGVGIPMCYPTWPVNGRLLSGYPNPDPRRFFTYPADWASELAETLPAADSHELAEGEGALPTARLERIDARMQRLAAYLANLMRADAADFTMIVISATDHFQHWYWHLRGDRPAPDDPIDGVYRAADHLIGTLLQATDESWIVGVVSDHGAGAAPERLFVVNSWLRGIGLLARPEAGQAGLRRRAMRLVRRAAQPAIKSLVYRLISTETRQTLRALETASKLPDWTDTRAYFVRLAYPIGGLNLNVRGREPSGIVEPGDDFDRLRARIADELQRVIDPVSGARVVDQVWRREELFNGPHLESAPDLLFQVAEPYFPANGMGDAVFRDVSISPHEMKSGQHRMDGMLVLSGAGRFRAAAQVSGATVMDVAPTLLHAMGLPVPLGLDGRVLSEAFEPQGFAAQPIMHHEDASAAALEPSEYSDEEEEGIRAALRGLGYVE